MGSERANLRAAAALVDNLAAAGLRHLCLSPGSRSAPLALAAAGQPRLRRYVITDERDAGFFALGIARATGLPAAALCTSGTAAASFMPAVAEASRARVPLIVITADRPTELRDSGAAQTISQSGLFASHVCWSVDAAVPDESWAYSRYFAVLGCRAFATARRCRAPVHVNVALREPLWSDEELGLIGTQREAVTPAVRFDDAGRRLQPASVSDLAERLLEFERGLLVCGPGTGTFEDTRAFVELACALEWPLLVDSLSGLRFGAASCRGAERVVVDAYDIMLRSPDTRRAHRPDAVVRFGALPTSKPLVRFLAEDCDAYQVAVWPGGLWADPDFVVSEVVESEPAAVAAALAAEISGSRVPHAVRSGGGVAASAATSRDASTKPLRDDKPAVSAWLDTWMVAQTSVRASVARALDGSRVVFEGSVAAALVGALPDGATLFAGNSLPVRALDTFVGASDRRVNVIANRGANGIDGVTATALGAASVADGPCLLFTGDLSFLHDIGALQIAHRHEISLTIVVVNNDGGGIFSFLPRPADRGMFEELFSTPHGLPLGRAVEMCGGTHLVVASVRELAQAVKDATRGRGLRVIEIETERERTVEHQRMLVESALAELAEATRGRP